MNEETHLEQLYIGLGNPGAMYAKTRHNLGFLVVDRLAHFLNWELKEDNRFKAKVVRKVFNGRCIHLMQPMTFMNKSGLAVRHYLDYYKINANHIVVVCDDVALEFGKLRLRMKGSAGGHNGLKSIIAHLNTQEFMRLRMGIGEFRKEEVLSDYVLNSFTAEETAGLSEFVERGAMALRDLTIDNASRVMNRINTK